MTDFVYIIDRDGELDVYADLGDAQEASKILGLPIVEQSIFAESSADTAPGSTREWLESLRAQYAPVDLSERCDSCGRVTGMDTGLCGWCAEDYNDRDRAAGIERINQRRIENGLAPIEGER